MQQMNLEDPAKETEGPASEMEEPGEGAEGKPRAENFHRETVFISDVEVRQDSRNGIQHWLW